MFYADSAGKTVKSYRWNSILRPYWLNIGMNMRVIDVTVSVVRYRMQCIRPICLSAVNVVRSQPKHHIFIRFCSKESKLENSPEHFHKKLLLYSLTVGCSLHGQYFVQYVLMYDLIFLNNATLCTLGTFLLTFLIKN